MTAPEAFWQRIDPADTFPATGPFIDAYPATLPGGRQLLLPIRVLPGDGTKGVAGLIVNQATFAVFDELAEALTAIVAPLEPDLIVGVPTLGLPLAEAVARRLGHARMVSLSTSRKFWYDDGFAVALASVTTPERRKSLYLDPHMLPLLETTRRVVLVDDVVSSGQSAAAALALLGKAGVAPLGLAAVMLQTERWQERLAEASPAWPGLVRGVFATPALRRSDGGWVAG